MPIANRTMYLVACLSISLSGCAKDSAFDKPNQPDTSHAWVLDRWPNDADLARLKSVESKPQVEVLQTLGHPAHVERQADGTEVWSYPWVAVCQVHLRDGVCHATFYDAGY